MSQRKTSQIYLSAILAMTVWRNLSIRYLVLCGVFLIAAIAVGTALMVGNFRSRALAESERELKNTALILSEQIDRSFQAIELVQSSVAERVQSLGITSSEDYARQMSGRDVHLMLRDKINGLVQLDAITLIDANGKLLNFSRAWPIPAVNVADRDYFKVLKSDAKLTSYVSVPARNRGSDTWTMYLARKIATPNEEFLGLILGAVELSYFEKFFSAIDLGEGSSITVYRSDGVVLIRHPRNESVIGKSFASAINALGSGNSGTIRFIGKMAGKDRLLAAHRLDHYPLFISVAVDTAVALAGWEKETKVLLSAGSLAALTVAVMIFLIVRQLSQGHKLSNQRLELEKQRLDTAINNMPQGLLMFDSSNRIVVCNHRYIEMYGLSADLVKPGCTLDNLLCHRKATGSFPGNVDEFRSTLFYSLEQGIAQKIIRETADGRVIRVLIQPVTSGGWVATHEDITERESLLHAHNETEGLARERKVQLDAALNNMMQGLCMFDADGRIVLFNQRYVEMMELSADDLPGVSLLDVLERRKVTGQFTGDPKLLFSSVLARMRAGTPTTNITSAIDGRALRFVSQPMTNGGWVATIEDITEQRKTEQERDQDREFLNQIINNVPATIVVRDARTRKYVLINQAGEDYFGASRDQIIGKTVYDVWPKESADLIGKHDEQLLKSNGYLFFDEHSLPSFGESSRFVTLKKLIIRDGNGEPQYLLGVVEDISERKRSEERIAYLAHYDALTGLPNRVFFREQLERALNQVQRDKCAAVLYLDLDNFKAVNDTLGHPVGDELLKAVAARLRACLKETDIISRLGGDEFAIVQTAVKDPIDVIDLVTRIHEAIRAPCEAGGHQLVADISIGIALAPENGSDADQLLKNADLAMYCAKADGRGTHRFFEPNMDARVKARRELEFDLREAIMGGGLEVYYQPILKLGNNDISGCEALLRWRHSDRGMISPAVFIPVAEETGLIIPLGEWVLRTACAQAVAWPNDIVVAVNVSPAQFKRGNLVQVIINVLAASRLPARRLELEITEAILIHDDEAALAILHQLRGLGVRIALDDFGTGYSSLSYLQRFPFDKIKIDRSFIENVSDTDGSHSIVQAVVSIATARHITTTAEGVETQQQMDLLRILGCTEMQGYLFSPALPAEKLMELLLSHRERAACVA